MRPSLRHPATAAAVVLILLLLTALAAKGLRLVAVAPDTSADVALDLPIHLGDWTGEDIWYCQNEQCARMFRQRDLDRAAICPACGGALDKISIGERTLLPADTLLRRQWYTSLRGDTLTATVVLTGGEQRSIHRPEQCLPAQGFVIESARVVAVDLPGRLPFQVMLLRARYGGQLTGREPPRVLYAYWFAGGGHETPNHIRRLMWMAWDNLVHGVRPRWAYVSLQTPLAGNPHDAEQRLLTFARAFYPAVRRP